MPHNWLQRVTVWVVFVLWLATPQTTQAYCWWTYCGSPSAAECPNRCGEYDYWELFWDEYCWEYESDYCIHKICFWLDEGPDPSGCPDDAVCASTDQWGCGPG